MTSDELQAIIPLFRFFGDTQPAPNARCVVYRVGCGVFTAVAWFDRGGPLWVPRVPWAGSGYGFHEATPVPVLSDDEWMLIEDVQFFRSNTDLDLAARVLELQSQIQHWIENGCIPPPTKEELANYACSQCKVRGVKLWRPPHRDSPLKCAKCLAPDMQVDDEGRVPSEFTSSRIDQVNDWLPAVPAGNSFWGYTSVPPQPVGWWRGLPTYPDPRVQELAIQTDEASKLRDMLDRFDESAMKCYSPPDDYRPCFGEFLGHLVEDAPKWKAKLERVKAYATELSKVSGTVKAAEVAAVLGRIMEATPPAAPSSPSGPHSPSH